MKAYPKKEKKAYIPRFLSNGQTNPEAFTQPTAKQREQLKVTANTPASWMNADGTKNWDKYNDFLEQREKDSWNSKSL